MVVLDDNFNAETEMFAAAVMVCPSGAKSKFVWDNFLNHVNVT